MGNERRRGQRGKEGEEKRHIAAIDGFVKSSHEKTVMLSRLKVRAQGQGLVNWSSRILEDKNFPREQQYWKKHKLWLSYEISCMPPAISSYTACANCSFSADVYYQWRSVKRALGLQLLRKQKCERRMPSKKHHVGRWCRKKSRSRKKYFSECGAIHFWGPVMSGRTVWTLIKPALQGCGSPLPLYEVRLQLITSSKLSSDNIGSSDLMVQTVISLQWYTMAAEFI